MPQRTLFRFFVLAGLAVIAGFLALVIAVPIEPQVPAPLIALFFTRPETRRVHHAGNPQSMAWTFGWFLRIAIAANAAFYFAILALLAYVADRRQPQ